MHASDIRKMTDEAILNEIEDKKEALFNLRFQAASGQLEDPNEMGRARREIARLKTILRERQLAAEQTRKEGENA